jgi:hypothetical protein
MTMILHILVFHFVQSNVELSSVTPSNTVQPKAKTNMLPQIAILTLKCFPCILVSYGTDTTKLLLIPTACTTCKIRLK